MTMYERIKMLREKYGMSQQELAEKVGFKTASAVNKIELGLRDLNQTKIMAFAKALHTTPAYLMGWDNIAINDEEYGKMVRAAGGVNAKKIPVLGKVVAGIPIDAVEEILDYEEISPEMARQGDFFALQVKGDSMEPKFSDGDVVIVRKQEDVDSGDIAIVLVNGDEATIKKLQKFDGGINLVPSNQSYPVLTYSYKDIEQLPVRVIGKAVELRAKF